MSDGQTFTPKHLEILRYLKSTGQDWVSLKRAETQCRINGQKLAIAEELLELSAEPLNKSFQPLVRLHRSGKHFQITERGIEACDKYKVVQKTIDLGNGKTRTVETVVTAATGKAAGATDPTSELLEDDDEDELPPEARDDLSSGAEEEYADEDVTLDPDPEVVRRPEPEPEPEAPRPSRKKTTTKKPAMPAPQRPIGKPAGDTIPEPAEAPKHTTKRRSLPK